MKTPTKLKIRDLYGNLAYNTNSRDGAFFMFSWARNEVGEILICREEFAWHWRKRHPYMGICCSGAEAVKLREFWKIVEKDLNIKEKTIFFETDKQNAVVVRVSAFWRKDKVRRSLFTLLLRCGAAYYYKGDFEGALKSYNLTNSCIPAVKRFLAGYTQCLIEDWSSYYGQGFVWAFRDCSGARLKQVLVSP